MRRYDGLSRLAWAALSAGLCRLSGCLVRASDAFLASGRHHSQDRSIARHGAALGK